MQKTGLKRRLKPVLSVVITFIAAIWVIELVDLFVMSNRLDAWGIHPRSMWGLVGIPLSPFLHGGFGHLISNTIPLLILGTVVGFRGVRNLVEVTTIIALVGGAGVWLIGKSASVHIGASGLVFGFFGFLITRGFFDKSIRSLLVGVGVLLFYGGLIWGVLPTDPNVSWEGHLCGLLAGALAARMLANRTPSSSFSIE
jgi:membrane associated rhomboid family serine protease